MYGAVGAPTASPPFFPLLPPRVAYWALLREICRWARQYSFVGLRLAKVVRLTAAALAAACGLGKNHFYHNSTFPVAALPSPPNPSFLLSYLKS